LPDHFPEPRLSRDDDGRNGEREIEPEATAHVVDVEVKRMEAVEDWVIVTLERTREREVSLSLTLTIGSASSSSSPFFSPPISDSGRGVSIM